MKKLSVSICIPAYNEEKNIPHILSALIRQKTNQILIKKIIVVCSGCTDKTAEIVHKFIKKDKRIQIIIQAKRNGKAVAINAFLKAVSEPVVVIESADTIPDRKTIEYLCIPFINEENIGMTGGAPIPINDPNTFLGYVIHSWWWFHRNIPRFGEIVAYRNILKKISATTAVDEAFIQAKIIQRGLKAVHIDQAVVTNKGPETVKDLIKQRRRIFNGHSRLFDEEKVKIDHMTKSSLKLLLFEYKIHSLKQLIWLTGGILIEIWSQGLGFYDNYYKKVNPFVWDTAGTTKDLNASVNSNIRKRRVRK